jgi:hypothetical protein
MKGWEDCAKNRGKDRSQDSSQDSSERRLSAAFPTSRL